MIASSPLSSHISGLTSSTNFSFHCSSFPQSVSSWLPHEITQASNPRPMNHTTTIRLLAMLRRKSIIPPSSTSALTSLTCSSREGIMFALPSACPYGDFASLPAYKWSFAAQRDYREHKTMPARLSDLPHDTNLATYTYHMPQFRASNGDIHITKADFERLEATPRATAVLWSIDHSNVLFMPKPAIAFSEAQKRAYRDGTIQDQSAPLLGQCLVVGYRPQDLTSGAGGNPVMPGGGQMSVVSVGELVESLGVA